MNKVLKAGCAALVAALSMVAGSARAESRTAWRMVQPPAAAAGIDGVEHTATCSGFPGTDAAFRFYVRRGTSRNLMVYFEGGGACWDNGTCSFPDVGLPARVPQYFTPAVAGSPSQLGGIFNTSRNDNPVRDWDMVYIPYCTGDLHAGDATRTYLRDPQAVLPTPPQFDIQHRGFSNLMVVLDWVKRNVDAPQRVLVAGSSAGGYGATVNFPWFAAAFPGAQLSVLADASQGVTTPAWDQGTPGRGNWNVQLPTWAAGIDPATLSGPELMRRSALANPGVRVAQFTTRLDLEQAAFYGLMKDGYGPGGSCPDTAIDWNRQMVDQLNRDRRDVPNYRHYLAAGRYHTVLTTSDFYNERSAGVAVNDWVAGLVSPDPLRRALLWRNVACLGCLIELPCPN